MSLSEIELKRIGRRYGLPAGIGDVADAEVNPDQDGVMENMNSTPIGNLLKIIASLPEVRHEKVSSVRGELNNGQYNISDNLDEAIDRVLEELIAEG